MKETVAREDTVKMARRGVGARTVDAERVGRPCRVPPVARQRTVEGLVQQARWTCLVVAGLAEHLVSLRRCQESEAVVWAAYRVLRWLSEAERSEGRAQRDCLLRAAETNLALRALVSEWIQSRPVGRRLLEEIWVQSRKVGGQLQAAWKELGRPG